MDISMRALSFDLLADAFIIAADRRKAARYSRGYSSTSLEALS